MQKRMRPKNRSVESGERGQRRRSVASAWPESRGDPYHYLMIPHDAPPTCAAYIEALELRMNPKRPEWKLFWTDRHAWYHTAVGVRLIPSELFELLTLAETGECLDAAHVVALRELATAAAAHERNPDQPSVRTSVALAPILAACEALLLVLANPPPWLRNRFGRAIAKRYDLVGRTAHLSPFGWFAAATEELRLHAGCATIRYLAYFEIMLG